MADFGSAWFAEVDAGACGNSSNSIVPGALVCATGSGTQGAAGCTTGASNCHQLPGAARDGAMDDTTSVARARVIATYKALSSSRLRWVSSNCTASTAQAGGRFSLTRNRKRRGWLACAGQSTSTPMLCAAGSGVSVSSSSTASASNPLAPWMVSRRTASGSTAAGACTPLALKARTSPYGLA